MAEDGVETVRGRELTVRFEARKCIHSRNCVLGRPDVFVPNVQGEWIHPDRATAAELVELAHNCPSGAIRVEHHDGASAETPPVVNTLRLRENGPLAVHAPLQVGGAAAGLRATLCRCGASKRKPWCDGSHAAAGFVASGEPPTEASEPLARRDGPVTIEPTLDGPLHATGSLEVVSGTGRTLKRVTEAWLCRCGASATKPWCDGSHRKIGFRST